MQSHSFRQLGLLAAAAATLLLSACSRDSRSRSRLERANEHFTAGRYDEAEIEYKNVLKADPKNTTSISRLGMIYQEQGRIGHAVGFLSKAKELDPASTQVRVKLGLAMLGAGYAQGARTEALAVLDLEPENRDAPLLLAESSQTIQETDEARRRLVSLPSPAADSAPVLTALAHLELRRGGVPQAEALIKRASAAEPKYEPLHCLSALMAWSRNDLQAADKSFQAALENAPIRSTNRAQYAQFKLRTGDAEGARKLLQEITQKAPDYIPGWLWLTEIALSQRKLDDAANYIERALGRDNMQADTLLLSARVSQARGDHDKAGAVLERLLGLYPNSTLGHYHLGLVRAAKGDRAQARDSFNRALAITPGFAPAAIAAAELNVAFGDYAVAADALKPLVAKQPGATGVQLLLVDAYRGLGDLNAATSILETIEKKEPSNARIPLLRGQILSQRGDRDAARVAFARAAELAPDSMLAMEQLIALDVAEKKYENAKRTAQAAAARNPKSAEPLVALARVLLIQNDTAAAEKELQRAISIEPGSSAAHVLLARLNIVSKRYPEAVSNLQQLVAKNPNDSIALAQLAVLHEMRDDVTSARAAYEKLLEVDPKSALALNNLAYLYGERFNELDKAYELANRARALNGNDARIADTLGWVQYRRGQYPQALALLQDSASKLPDEPDAQVHLALTQYMLVQESAARATLEQILARWPEAKAANELKERLAILSVDPAKPAAADSGLLQKAAEKKPADPVALSRLAALHLRERNLDKAQRAAEAAREISPKAASVAVLLAEIHAAQGQQERALELAKEGRSLAPDNAHATHVLGRLAGAAGQHKWSATLLREAAEKLPDNPEVHFDSALAAYSIGSVAEAKESAQRALDLSPGFVRAGEARRFLRLIEVTPASLQSANPAGLREAVAEEPASVPALMATAMLSELRKDADAARKAYEQALEKFPDFSPAQRGLTLLNARSEKNPGNAVALATKARQAYPSDPDVAKAYGIVLYRQGEFSRAAMLLRESAAARTNDGELQYYLGMALLKQKRNSESRPYLARALELGVDEKLAVEAKQGLSATNQ